MASPYTIDEARNSLVQARPARLVVLNSLLNSVIVVPDAISGTVLPTGIKLPAKDEPPLLAAISAQSTHFLSGDIKHFGPYFGQTFAGVLILKPAAYLQSRQATP